MNECTGREKGRLWPRLVQKVGEGKSSCELRWKVKAMNVYLTIYKGSAWVHKDSAWVPAPMLGVGQGSPLTSLIQYSLNSKTRYYMHARMNI